MSHEPVSVLNCTVLQHAEGAIRSRSLFASLAKRSLTAPVPKVLECHAGMSYGAAKCNCADQASARRAQTLAVALRQMPVTNVRATWFFHIVRAGAISESARITTTKLRCIRFLGSGVRSFARKREPVCLQRGTCSGRFSTSALAHDRRFCPIIFIKNSWATFGVRHGDH
jgi:hypothetical protein